jgi:hypothetical protein
MPLIVTSQAPVAKQKSVNLALTTTEAIMVEAPGYTVPLLGFNAGTRRARGVVEFSSPLLVTNITTVSATFTARIIRVNPAGTFVIANQVPVEPTDTLIFPLNGQFLLREIYQPPPNDTLLGLSGDYLDIKASANTSLVATLSYTEGQAEEDDVT